MSPSVGHHATPALESRKRRLIQLENFYSVLVALGIGEADREVHAVERVGGVPSQVHRLAILVGDLELTAHDIPPVPDWGWFLRLSELSALLVRCPQLERDTGHNGKALEQVLHKSLCLFDFKLSRMQWMTRHPEDPFAQPPWPR